MLKSRTLLCLLLAFVSLCVGFSQGGKPTKEQLAKVEKYYVSVKADFKKNPKSAKAKKAFVETGNNYAMMIMQADWLPPRDMYPKALKVYREVKKADPSNKEATQWIKQIEGIYKSMGRPIPPQ